MFVHVWIVKSNPVVDLESHQISAIENWGIYQISQSLIIHFSVHVCSAKYLCTDDLLPSFHPTVDLSCKLTSFHQCHIYFKLCIFPWWNHLQPLIFYDVHLIPSFLSPYNLDHIFLFSHIYKVKILGFSVILHFKAMNKPLRTSRDKSTLSRSYDMEILRPFSFFHWPNTPPTT